MEYDPEKGRLLPLKGFQAPNVTSEARLVSREVPHPTSEGRFVSGEVRAVRPGVKTVADRVANQLQEHSEKEKDLDLLERLAREFKGPGSHTRLNLAPDAPRRPDEKISEPASQRYDLRRTSFFRAVPKDESGLPLQCSHA